MENEKKMTKAEMFAEIINLATDSDRDDIVAFCEHEKELIAKRNANKSSKPTKTQLANEPIKDAIVELLTTNDSEMTATDIGTALEISTQKASTLCRQLVNDGKVSSKEVKGKNGKCKGYFIEK